MPKARLQESDKVGLVKAILDKPGNVAILLIVTAVVLISLEWPFHLVSKYLARDSKPSSSFVCTGGNCVQNGTQVVDNRTYATQPLPNIVGLKMSDATGRNLSPLEGELAKNPGQSATFTLDRSFPEAIFDITCDRPCQATDAVIAGVREPREMHDPDDPNATGIAVGNSAPVAAGTRIMVIVRSKDSKPIKVLNISPYADPVDAPEDQTGK